MTGLPPITHEVLLEAPRVLLWTGLGCGFLSAIVALRLVGRLFGQRRVSKPVSLVGVLLSLICSLGLGALAAVALGLCVAMAGYRAFTARTHVAEVQCVELAPKKLHLYYVNIEPDGHRDEAETYDVEGDEWAVGGQIVRFVPQLTALGVHPVQRITRVEGRWLTAADANAHHATAYDRGGGVDTAWLWMERNGQRGPLGWAIAGVHGQSISQLPDRRAIYDVYVTPNGYVVEKRSL